MTRFMVDLGDGRSLEIDRSSCCGGVFLDAGEHQALVERTRRLTGPQSSERKCPQCSSPFRASMENGVEIDTCVTCGGVWLESADLQEKGFDVAILFGAAPELLREVGPSPRNCPVHGTPMTSYAFTILGDEWEIERATCCGGVFLDATEQEVFTRVARKVAAAHADRKFAAGESMMTDSVHAAFLDMRSREVERKKQREAKVGKMKVRQGIAAVVSVIASSDWDDDY